MNNTRKKLTKAQLSHRRDAIEEKKNLDTIIPFDALYKKRLRTVSSKMNKNISDQSENNDTRIEFKGAFANIIHGKRLYPLKPFFRKYEGMHLIEKQNFTCWILFEDRKKEFDLAELALAIELVLNNETPNFLTHSFVSGMQKKGVSLRTNRTHKTIEPCLYVEYKRNSYDPTLAITDNSLTENYLFIFCQVAWQAYMVSETFGISHTCLCMHSIDVSETSRWELTKVAEKSVYFDSEEAPVEFFHDFHKESFLVRLSNWFTIPERFQILHSELQSKFIDRTLMERLECFSPLSIVSDIIGPNDYCWSLLILISQLLSHIVRKRGYEIHESFNTFSFKENENGISKILDLESKTTILKNLSIYTAESLMHKLCFIRAMGLYANGSNHQHIYTKIISSYLEKVDNEFVENNQVELEKESSTVVVNVSDYFKYIDSDIEASIIADHLRTINSIVNIFPFYESLIFHLLSLNSGISPLLEIPELMLRAIPKPLYGDVGSFSSIPLDLFKKEQPSTSESKRKLTVSGIMGDIFTFDSSVNIENNELLHICERLNHLNKSYFVVRKNFREVLEKIHFI